MRKRRVFESTVGIALLGAAQAVGGAALSLARLRKSPVHAMKVLEA